jgi:hypothetical protein
MATRRFLDEKLSDCSFRAVAGIDGSIFGANQAKRRLSLETLVTFSTVVTFHGSDTRKRPFQAKKSHHARVRDGLYLQKTASRLLPDEKLLEVHRQTEFRG